MKLVASFFFVPSLVLAQVPPKPVSPQVPSLPPGWIVLIPPENGVTSPTKKPFQLPKDWVFAKPDGVPYSAPATVAGITTPTGQIDWTPYPAKSEADDVLVKAQSLAIQSLRARVDQLEARIKELEARTGGKK